MIAAEVDACKSNLEQFTLNNSTVNGLNSLAAINWIFDDLFKGTILSN